MGFQRRKDGSDEGRGHAQVALLAQHFLHILLGEQMPFGEDLAQALPGGVLLLDGTGQLVFGDQVVLYQQFSEKLWRLCHGALLML
jgi:hypothetical protein